MVNPSPIEKQQDRVRLVQRLYEAFAHRRIDEILTMLAPDVEWSEPDNPLNPAAGTRRGHSGFMEWARVGAEAEEILTLEPRAYLTGAEAVAVVGHTRCRARTTGRTYETDFVHLIEFRGDRIVRFQEFFDTFAAAEAFRMEEASAGEAS
jgi:ketosteroid isomerase-like protein